MGRKSGLVAVVAALLFAPAGPGSRNVTVTFQNMQRRYLLHVPPNPSGALVLAFHGGSETPEEQEQLSGLDAVADRERFIAAYPAGIDRSWNDGRGTTSAEKQAVDDVGFARAVVGR